jgi:hypothetical protein
MRRLLARVKGLQPRREVGRGSKGGALGYVVYALQAIQSSDRKTIGLNCFGNALFNGRPRSFLTV